MPTIEQELTEMSNAEYHASPGLSYSALKTLAVSPLRFWYEHINPDRPEREETPEMLTGSALHCAVLEPNQFASRYYTAVDAPEGTLDTIEDLRECLRSAGRHPKGTRKADLILQVQETCPYQPILAVLEAAHEAEHAGKAYLNPDQWQRVHGMAEALRSHAGLAEILREGRAEVPLSAVDPNTGVLLRCKLDWWRPDLTLDLKTFSQQRGKPIDRTIHDAIWYEKYHWQAWLYTHIRGILKDRKPRYVIAFVESDPPHEVRIRELRPTSPEVNVYWERARIDVTALIRLYAECRARFGDAPWRTDDGIRLLADEDVPQVGFLL
jgi:hypothetical protein